jgi:hypothetical protein
MANDLLKTAPFLITINPESPILAAWRTYKFRLYKLIYSLAKRFHEALNYKCFLTLKTMEIRKKKSSSPIK